MLTSDSTSNELRPRVYYIGIIVSFNLCEEAFCGLCPLGTVYVTTSEVTCLIRTKLDGGLRHDFDDVQTIT